MQTVSQAWKDNQKNQLVGESFVEITYEVGDPEAQAVVAASDNGSEDFADTPQVVSQSDKEMVKYATLEEDIWVLDGSMLVLPDEPPYGDNGYVGTEISQSDGTFLTNPKIILTFPSVQTNLIPGISIAWASAYGEWADSFSVTAYNGATVVASETITGNTSLLTVASIDLNNYDKVEIEIIKWGVGNRRARIADIFLGVRKTYTKLELMGFTHTQEVDLLSASLPKNEIVFEINNVDGQFNPSNPQGVEKYLIERQMVKVRYGYKIGSNIEWIKGGTFFISEWDTPQNGITASFTAKSLLEYMNKKFTGSASGVTLQALATAALNQANLPLTREGQPRWVLDSSLGAITVNATLDNTIAEVLQLCANAACCVIYQDREGILHIEPYASVLSDYIIDQFNSYKNSEILTSKKLMSVNVNDGAAIITNEDEGEVQEVDNVLIPAGQAATVGNWVKDILKNRNSLTGEFRADPRLDPLDVATVKNKYAENIVIVTQIKYSYNGAFRGSYEGRVIPQ